MKRLFMTAMLLQLLVLKVYSQEEPIELITANCKIKGTLTLPAQKQDIPLVLIISGSGPTDRDCNQPRMKTNAFKYLADDLQKNGIASVRFDKRGIAESADTNVKEINMRFDDFIDDVKAWIELLSKDKRFSGLIIAGHSEGSLIGMAACKNNNKVKGYISIAGAGRPIDEVLKEQLAAQSKEYQDIVFPMIDRLKKGDTIQNVAKSLYTLFRPSVQPYMISWLKYNPQEEISKLNIPILILQGSTDIQVSETDADLLAKANPAAKEKIIKNMNHVLKDCDTKDKKINMATYFQAELPLNKEFVKVIIKFIKGIK
ncbi:MAG: alpha/beta hydrolase [Bacteroidales bacterium]